MTSMSGSSASHESRKLNRNNVLHQLVIAVVAFLVALPLSTLLFPFIPRGPEVFGIGVFRSLTLAILFIAAFFLLRRFRRSVYAVLIVAVAVLAFTTLKGGYGFNDLAGDYGMMLTSLEQSTQALPKVRKLKPFYRAAEVREAIDYQDPSVRSFAVQAATTWFNDVAAEDADFTMIQAFSIFKVINSSWIYVSDPMDGEYFAKAEESARLLAGDCDDHAILMAACIKAIGGKVRLVRTTGHIYPEMNVGDAQAMQRAAYLIRNVLFPEEARHAALYYHTDANGDRWINLDYTRHYPGGEVMNEKITGILHV